MAMHRRIQDKNGRYICRSCINRLYGVRLKTSDCRSWLPYPQQCPCCGERRSIVIDLRLSGRLKLLGKRPHWDAGE